MVWWEDLQILARVSTSRMARFIIYSIHLTPGYVGSAYGDKNLPDDG
jgi:hypothetical protein